MNRFEETSNFHYIYSCDLQADVKIKIGTLEGKLPRIDNEQVIDKPILRFAGRNLSKVPDLIVSVVIQCGDVPLHLPVNTSYKNFTKRWEWNQWLVLPIKFCDLPVDSLLCITIWDCNGPGEKEAVGGTSISLFGKKGVFRSGMMDLVVWPGVEGDEKTPGKVKDTDKEQYHRLAKLSKKYHAGKIPAVDWLDRITFAEIERISQKDKSSSAKMYLNVEFPHTMDMDLPISVVFFELGGDTPVFSPQVSKFCPLPDPDIDNNDNLIEAKHHKLARSAKAGLSERDLRPNPETRDKLKYIIEIPVTQALTSEEQDLIWRYRYFLKNDKKALSKFVKCIKWSVEVEADQAMELIDQWVPMDVEDALELLGPTWRHPSLRRYAVTRLDQATDKDLQLYLPQLVQALKYEKISDARKKNRAKTSEFDDLCSFLIARANNDLSLANYLYWYLNVETKEETNNLQRQSVRSNKLDSNIEMYSTVLAVFLRETRFRDILLRQHKFVDCLVNLMKQVNEMGDRPKKIEKLKQLLQDEEHFNFDFSTPVPFPLDPTVEICGIVANEATLFKSNLCPARITFVTKDGKRDYTSIFKNGDDLRQDQLILQIISLMDQLLKKENLDLKLTPYRALATSSTHGFVQFVKATGIADVIRENRGGILEFFKKHNPSQSGPNGVSSDCMDQYVKSCAGYCVITYLLGVGDRHLDNLMLTSDGKLLHIDFGFILGRDPKPMPPPMRLSKEMIEGFGGVDSEHYKWFRKECHNAFRILRRNASLILNLFALMVDSSVPDIAMEPDKAVKKVQDKFRLDLNEEEAEQYMERLIEASQSTIAELNEWFHGKAMSLKN